MSLMGVGVQEIESSQPCLILARARSLHRSAGLAGGERGCPARRV